MMDGIVADLLLLVAAAAMLSWTCGRLLSLWGYGPPPTGTDRRCPDGYTYSPLALTDGSRPFPPVIRSVPEPCAGGNSSECCRMCRLRSWRDYEHGS